MTNINTNPTLEELNTIMADHCGNLDLTGAQITALPDGLVVCGNLDLSYCDSLTALPENLTVGGDCELYGCTSLAKLPDTLVVSVDSHIGIQNTAIPESDLQAVHRLNNGDYLEDRCLFADGTLTPICGKPKQYGRYTYFAGKIEGNNVVCDGQKYERCEDFMSGVSILQCTAVCEAQWDMLVASTKSKNN